MIEQHFPALKPSIVVTPISHSVSFPRTHTAELAAQRNISEDEYKRRDAIIHKLTKDLSYKVGDIVYPQNIADYEKYGAFIVHKIVTLYSQLEKTFTWPANDLPMLLTIIACKDRTTTMFATPNWVTRQNKHLSCTC